MMRISEFANFEIWETAWASQFQVRLIATFWIS